jgi:hypothetical protein
LKLTLMMIIIMSSCNGCQFLHLRNMLNIHVIYPFQDLKVATKSVTSDLTPPVTFKVIVVVNGTHGIMHDVSNSKLDCFVHSIRK